MPDRTEALRDRVLEAARARYAIAPLGTGSKGFLGNPVPARPLSTAEHSGIVDYQPSELVVTVRAGTSLSELAEQLACEGQVLPFDPPRFPPGGTVGGAVAAGLAGPGRPWHGGVRDHVLGIRMLDGRGELLRFGGQVMKNVAGYDVSRAMCGSLGSLGLLLEVSFRVLPLAEREISLVFEAEVHDAVERLSRWQRRPLPITGAAWENGRLHVRLSGSDAAIRAARTQIGGDEERPTFWTGLRDQALPFFRHQAELTLWRLSVPATSSVAGHDPERLLLDWAGAQRWVLAEPEDEGPARLAQTLGGYAVRFRQPSAERPWQILRDPLLWLNQQVKRSFDPDGIFNPGRLHPGC